MRHSTFELQEDIKAIQSEIDRLEKLKQEVLELKERINKQ